MTAEELLSLLPATTLLAACSAAELVDLLSRSRIDKAKKRDVLIHQGDPGDTVIVLISGAARVSIVASNGREIVLDYLGPGAVMGEIAVLDGGERTATVTMMEDGRILRIGRTAYLAFVESHPRVAVRMLEEMARRLRQMDETVESDRAFSSGPRLARYLQRLFNKDVAARLPHIELSQTELGAFAGISREHVNRQLSAWADEGLIELEHGRIRIIDGEALRQIAAVDD